MSNGSLSDTGIDGIATNLCLVECAEAVEILGWIEPRPMNYRTSSSYRFWPFCVVLRVGMTSSCLPDPVRLAKKVQQSKEWSASHDTISRVFRMLHLPCVPGIILSLGVWAELRSDGLNLVTIAGKSLRKSMTVNH